MNAGTRAQELIDLIVDEASSFDHIGRTIVARRIMGVLSGWLPEQEKAKCDPAGLVPMTDQEARAFEEERMEFGHYAGTKFKDVPVDYLRWRADASRQTWRSLHRYLHSNRVLGEIQTFDEVD